MTAETRRWIVVAVVAWMCVAVLNVAKAQGFGEHTTCYSWNGGNHSSGSFIQCDTYKVERKAPVVLPPPVQASPVMMPMSAPVTCAPAPKPVVPKKRHYKPAPKC